MSGPYEIRVRELSERNISNYSSFPKNIISCDSKKLEILSPANKFIDTALIFNRLF